MTGNGMRGGFIRALDSGAGCGIIAAERLLYAHVGRPGPRAKILASGRDGRVAYDTMNEIHGIMGETREGKFGKEVAEMAKKEPRLISLDTETQGLGFTRIFVDVETGVQYLYAGRGEGGGLTPLIDANGKLLINKEFLAEQK